ncbi:hypothetical protein ACQKJZ_04210 [Sphingomonas sp. NPDC019816]|uniref:hypothetical protein n=1 Tax=Sphingomonas sp. NPDC019816 TaxID=3390679 RepID=UPI003D036458
MTGISAALAPIASLGVVHLTDSEASAIAVGAVMSDPHSQNAAKQGEEHRDEERAETSSAHPDVSDEKAITERAEDEAAARGDFA